MAYCKTRTMTEWGIAFLKHLNVADASCRSCHGNKWPQDSIEPGRRVKSRAGVGAGGLSPNKSFAGSFIFLGRVDGVPARAGAPRADGAVLVFVCSASAEPCGLDFRSAGVDHVVARCLCVFCASVGSFSGCDGAARLLVSC